MIKVDETDLMTNNNEDLIVNNNSNSEGNNDQEEEAAIGLLIIMNPSTTQEEPAPEIIRVDTSNAQFPISSTSTGNFNSLSSEKSSESIWYNSMPYRRLRVLQKKREPVIAS